MSAATTPDSSHEALARLKARLNQEADSLAPWFFENMPGYYFRSHSPEEQINHLHALVTGQVADQRQSVILRGPEETRVTHLSPGVPGELVAVLAAHSAENIQTARVYTSNDGSLLLSTFLIGPQELADPASQGFRQAVQDMLDKGLIPAGRVEEFKRFLAGASRDYVEKFEPQRVARHFELSEPVCAREDVTVALEPLPDPSETRVALGMVNPPENVLLLRIARIFQRHDVPINRVYADIFVSADGQTYAIMSFYVPTETAGREPLLPGSSLWKRMEEDLRLVKWMAPHALETFADEEGFPLRRVMLLQSAAELAHQLLVRRDLHAYTSDNIVRGLLGHREIAKLLLDFFEARFDPESGSREQTSAEIEARALRLIEQVEDGAVREVFLTILRFFKHTLRTNYCIENIYGLGFRLDPAVLDIPEDEEKPFGAYFFHGPSSQAFHVRYRDMARGGVRVVPTRSQQQFELESNRLVHEVLALARAQQAKNKDIPEGGAKAVILLGPAGDISLAFKSMANSLLDLILPGSESLTLPGVVDYYGREELIYLGPDENIGPEHITWVVGRAVERGYRWAQAFMSSKPKAGISHKEYGVTSIGVIVFAEEILRTLGIDPENQPFSVKFTGGPKGDVAGNCMRLLMDKFGANVRIVAVTDGHGAAYDPLGLNHEELRRLISLNESIDSFDQDRLAGPGSFVSSTKTPEGVRWRNTLHNIARADLFLPSGGRPDTINLKNYSQFLDQDGTPTARAIVEGANIFISPEAREKLQQAGVLIVHGSSANKTGVICSSYEILGGLVMDTGEFLEIKDIYVDQVLDILRKRARDEARLMLKEHRARGGRPHLTDLTMAISREINELSDLFRATLIEEGSDPATDGELARVILDYCPPVLVEKYRDRILRDVPVRYLYSLSAKALASRIVYTEGLGWLPRLLAARPPGEVIRAYLRQEKRLLETLDRLRALDMPECSETARLLENAGRKFLTSEYLGLE